MRSEVATLPEVLRDNGYTTTCVGFRGNPASRGFDTYLDLPGWGSWNEGRSPKAQNLNEVTIPELERLSKAKQPFFLFLRHMDPHAPYLPPEPFERMFYHGKETDRRNKSMDPVMAFKPFCDFFASWMPPGITDKDYVIAQYDGEVAYMDAAIATILHGFGNPRIFWMIRSWWSTRIMAKPFTITTATSIIMGFTTPFCTYL